MKDAASAARLFKALSDPTRLRLVSLLQGGERCVCDLTDALGSPQPTVSRHLAALRRAGLVAQRQVGRWRRYRLNAAGPLQRRLLSCVEASAVKETACP